ncbi:hypothetical protein Tco_1149033 [Tanacetum coccineum]
MSLVLKAYDTALDDGAVLSVTTQVSQTNRSQSDLSVFGMKLASSVSRQTDRDSHVKNSVLANSKNSAKKVAVYVRKISKQIKSSAIVIQQENVNDVNVANAAKAKTLLCVSCMLNVLIPCYDKCLAKYKLTVHSNNCRALSTSSRTPTSSDTTYVVLKTRFSEKLTQSKSLDTTSVITKPKIAVESASKAKHKVVQIVLWIVDSGCSKHMMDDRSLLRIFIEKFMGTVRFGNDNFEAITGYGDYIHGNITICHVYYVEEGDAFLTRGRESNLYTLSISDMVASSPVCLMSKATSTKSCSNMEKITSVLLVKEENARKLLIHPNWFQSYNMGLWYPKDSGFELISYSDVDHAGCKDDCKSTSGGFQFLDIQSTQTFRYHFIKEMLRNGTVELYFVGTDTQLRNLFSKALPKERFEILFIALRLRCLIQLCWKSDKLSSWKRSYIR